MKFSMRQWRKVVLAAILAWALLFLGLLSYFLDTRVEEPRTPAGSLVSQHSDTRRLTSIQSSQQQQSVVGVRSEQGLNLPRTSIKNQPEAGVFSSSEAPGNRGKNISSSSPDQIYESQETNHLNELDLQSLAAWSSFGTQNVGSNFNAASQLRDRTSQSIQDQSTNHYFAAEDEEGRENEDEDLANEIRPSAERRSDADFVVQQLWKGTVSSGMLSPRLRQAMKDYINANKHHVSYQGHRKVARSADKLLCQMKNQSQLRTVDGSEKPFSSLGWANFVPSKPLQSWDKRQGGKSFKTCAVVSSAGAILHSGLGEEIGEYSLSLFIFRLLCRLSTKKYIVFSSVFQEKL
ncbi:beta-galactoside alpha-2,6-sialyltransferase 2 [Oryzias melastigma]|nr:beta-galactoside alpha-2,6-sialyltransferase 2 [Oryzias melastigma]